MWSHSGHGTLSQTSHLNEMLAFYVSPNQFKCLIYYPCIHTMCAKSCSHYMFMGWLSRWEVNRKVAGVYSFVRWRPSRRPVQFNICRRARTGFLTRRRDIFQLSLWRRNMIFPLSHQVVFAPQPFAHQCHNMQFKSISVNILAKIYSGHWVTDDSPVNVLVSMSHVMWLVLHRCLCSVRPDEAGILANGLCSHNVHLISN